MSKFKVYEVKENIPYEAITAVLNEAYKEWLDDSLNYAAAVQDAETTKKRIDGGGCIVVETEGKIVATVTYHIYEKEHWKKWYIDGKYMLLTQLAVLPEYRKQNVLMLLTAYVLRNPMKDKEMACVIVDTSVEAKHLVDSYLKMKTQIVDYVSWPNTNYYSYVFRRPVNGKVFDDEYCKKKLRIAKCKCILQYKKNGQRTILGKIRMRIKKK